MRGCASSGTRPARSRADDLGAIVTLGFRGEALPSMASVSHFRLRTRARGSDERHRDSRQWRRDRIGGRGRRRPRARCVEVADLFYNLPARRKFLKSDAAESRADLAVRDAAGALLSARSASR